MRSNDSKTGGSELRSLLSLEEDGGRYKYPGARTVNGPTAEVGDLLLKDAFYS